MASHLTVTTNAAGLSSSKSLNGSTGAGGDEGAFDVFAALLGAAAPKVGADAAKTSSANVDVNLGDLVKLSLGFGDGETQGNEDPDAIAAVVDAVVPFQEALDAGSGLAEIASTLANLKASLEAGEPLDPEMLKQLEAALSDLAAALDIDLDALPSIDDLTALVTDIQPDDVSFAARVTAAFGPVAETLFSGSAAPDAGEELSALLKSIGDKLAALLSALNSGELEPDQLAQLELGAKADADLDAVLARLLKPAVAVDTDPATQALATPELKLTEPALTGKASTDAPAATDAAETPETPATKAATETEDTGDRGDDSAPPERKPVERPQIAAALDKQPEAQANTQTAPAARVDIVAAPRVVQAGYQTSQQQLNLPQLTFEIVRQVNDGNTRFQIRLDPPELGRIDVKLDIDKSGQVHARLTVEKAETLDLMQRDQRGLERALQQAGLDGAKTNLEFSLKQNPFSSGGQHGQDGGSGNNPVFGDEVTAEADDTPPPTVNLYRGSLSASGVNIIA